VVDDIDIKLLDDSDAIKETKKIEPRANFSVGTIRDLYKSTGGLCSNCGCVTIARNPETETIVSIGEAAHIFGAKRTERSPRSNEDMTDAEISSFDNGIWLCRSCHKQIDYDFKEFSSLRLKEMKKEAEKKAYELLHKELDKGVVLDPMKFDLMKYSNFQKAFLLEAINDEGFYTNLGDNKERFLDPFYRKYGHKIDVKRTELTYSHFEKAFQDFQASGFGDIDDGSISIDFEKLCNFVVANNDDIENIRDNLNYLFKRE
jgi:hypothetical protein